MVDGKVFYFVPSDGRRNVGTVDFEDTGLAASTAAYLFGIEIGQPHINLRARASNGGDEFFRIRFETSPLEPYLVTIFRQLIEDVLAGAVSKNPETLSICE